MKRELSIVTGTLLLLLTFTPLSAQEEAPVDEGRSPATERETATPANTGQTNKTPLPPPGFYKGALFFSFLGGKTLFSDGSLITHEKDYVSSIHLAVQNGSLPTILGRYTLPPVKLNYTKNENSITQSEVEYGFSSHFGFTVSVMSFSIMQYQQMILPGYMNPTLSQTQKDAIMASETDNISNYNYTVPFNFGSTLYKGNGVFGGLSFHPIAGKLADPYIVLRLGISGFKSAAHKELYPSIYDILQTEQSGLGYGGGLGVGANFLIFGMMGLKAEITHYRQILKTSDFGNRSLNTYHLQAGIIINMEFLSNTIRESM